MAKLAADVSKYTAPLNAADIKALRDMGVDTLQVTTEDPEVAFKQLEMGQHDFDCQLIVAFDDTLPVYDQILRARTIAKPFRVDMLWVQCVPHGPATFPDFVKHFDEALFLARGVDFYEVGVFATRGSWVATMDNTVDYAEFPLMYENRDEKQELTAKIWREQGFGGWWRPNWKRFKLDHPVNGQVVDLSVGN